MQDIFLLFIPRVGAISSKNEKEVVFKLIVEVIKGLTIQET